MHSGVERCDCSPYCCLKVDCMVNFQVVSLTAILVPGTVCRYGAYLWAQLLGYLWESKKPVTNFWAQLFPLLLLENT